MNTADSTVSESGAVPNPLYLGEKKKKGRGPLLKKDRHADDYEKYSRLKTKNAKEMSREEREAEYEQRLQRAQQQQQAAAAETPEQKYQVKHVMMVTEVSETRARELLADHGSALAAIDAVKADAAAKESDPESSDGEQLLELESAKQLAKANRRKRGAVRAEDLSVGDSVEYLDGAGTSLGPVTVDAISTNVPIGEPHEISVRMPNGNVRETTAERLRYPGNSNDKKDKKDKKKRKEKKKEKDADPEYQRKAELFQAALQRRLDNPEDSTTNRALSATAAADRANRLRLYQAALERRMKTFSHMREAASKLDGMDEDPFFGSKEQADSAKKDKKNRKENSRKRRSGGGGKAVAKPSLWRKVEENLDQLEQYE